MRDHLNGGEPFAAAPRIRRVGFRAALAVGAGVGSVLLPFPAILIGVAILVIPVLYYWTPPLQPWLEGLLRAPIEAPGRRRGRMALVAVAGVLVIAGGSFGATRRARRVTETDLIASLRSDAEENLTEILQRAHGYLEQGQLEDAALVLMNADAVPYVETELRLEVVDLAGRIQRCNDAEFVLAVLRDLSREQLFALEAGTEVPGALQFDHPTLDERALELARALLDQVRAVP